MITKLSSYYSYIFRQKEFPVWIVYLNYGSLFGIFAWPLVAFGGIFMFDDPKTKFTSLDYLLLISYPLALMMLTFASYKLFQINKVISAALPTGVIIFYLFLIGKFILTFIGTSTVLRNA